MRGQLLCPARGPGRISQDTGKIMKYNAKICLLAAVFAASCTPLKIYYQEGETVARLDRDELACETAALRQVPADIRTRYIPPTYAPYQVCSPAGYCRTYDRIISPGRYERYDANRGLRARVTEQCMADKGYIRASIKRCDPETTRTTELSVTQVMPPLSAQSCAIRFKTGRWQIVTPEPE